MLYTSDHKGAPPKDLTSGTHGKHGDNTSKATKTHNSKDKDSDRLLSTQPPPQNHGTTSQSQWTLIELGSQRGNWRGWGRGQSRGNVTRTDDVRTQRGIQGACFNCGEQGHFTCNCPTKQKCANTWTAQLIDWSPEDNESNSGMTAVNSLYQQLNTLPKDNQEELMMRMGAHEGNFSEA